MTARENALRGHWWLVGIALVICIGWHLALFAVPTDGLVGTANLQNEQFHLLYAAPPESHWSDGGISLYSAILRVDAHDVDNWLRGVTSTSWQVGTSHQYLVERRDGDGKRVINTVLQRPSAAYFLQYLGIPALVALASLIAALAIALRYPGQPMLLPLTLLACGVLIGLSWQTFAVPFSYIALGWPFWGQIILHSLAISLIVGAGVHLALTFFAPLPIFSQYRSVILAVIYGFYPLGMVAIFGLTADLPEKLTTSLVWEQQAALILRGAAYVAWAAQYRRATVSQRSQLHWVLAGIAAYDLPYLVGALSGSDMLSMVQVWLGLLPPLGYIMGLLPDRRLRIAIGPVSGFIHGITNTLMAALFLAALGLAANVLVNTGQQDTLPVATLGLAIVFALTTAPLISLLREQLDSWFNGTRGAQRALLHQFTGKVSDLIALQQVTLAFQEALDQGVQPICAALWLWDDEVKSLRSVGLAANVPAIIPLDDKLLTSVLALTTCIPQGQIGFWPEGRDYFGAMALVSSGRLVGVCAIGPRIDGGAYSGDALRFFETLTRSATLAFRNAQLVAQLEDKVDALRGAYQQFITMQEVERQNLAADLHDETLQQLAHANLITAHLQRVVNETAEAPLKELQQNITSTERRLREILRGIHPAVLTDLGLVAALDSWLPRKPGVVVALTTTGFTGRRLTEAGLEITLYRLAQESVNNALKHAQATRIEVRLNWQADRVILEIADNGIGFIPTRLVTHGNGVSEGHFGLFNLRERVNAFDGHLSIESHPGRGTLIRAVLPVQEKDN